MAHLQRVGGAHAIVSTIGHASTVSALVRGLAPSGRLVLLGAGKDPLPIAAGQLVVGERSVVGSITGSPYENERTLDFSVLADIRPRIETMPLEQANDAYQRMRSGDVKFRMVLTMGAPRCNLASHLSWVTASGRVPRATGDNYGSSDHVLTWPDGLSVTVVSAEHDVAQ